MGGQGGVMGGQGGAMGGQGQAMGNNQNEDYGDKGLFLLAGAGYYADRLEPQDSTSSKRRPDTQWDETRTRRSLMEREICLRRLLGEFSFLFWPSLRSRRKRGNMKGNLIQNVLRRKQLDSKYSN
jgi:hypothetical protein